MVRIAKLPADKKFPQLGLLTDMNAARRFFQIRLPAFESGQLEITYIKMLRYRYLPGQNAWICYEMQITDHGTGEKGKQIFFGYLDLANEAYQMYRRALERPLLTPKYGPGLYFFPDFDMVMWGFPNDPKLPRLQRMLDESTFRKVMHEYREQFHIPAELSVDTLKIKIVKYVPQTRCTLRYDYTLSDGSHHRMYGKIFGRRVNAGIIYNTTKSLWDSEMSRRRQVLVPEPLLFVPEWNALFMSDLQGINMDERLDEIDLEKICAETGAILAGMQQVDIGGLTERSDRQTMFQVVKSQDTLSKFDARFTTRVDAITEKLLAQMPTLPQLPERPIHGAFRLSQVLLVEQQLALIDFDAFLNGNPVYDVASFVAHLMYLPLRDKITEPQAMRAINAFCDAYRENAPWGLPADVLHWQVAALLMGKQAKKCIKMAKKNYDEMIDQLLEMSEKVLDEKIKLI
ncbi:MAG: aminoglycoside phosphotransferase family protein [Calditrichia bacterium]|nr:aminoglycoside phosphotransferase family protein [Calditrichota bacterium]MCB0267755.1 aminoglycoside phosphotransferase family protein [Calditrichota bacterium]MCB0286909.1 aminoglycoside phosphotransferase family protein [Calditrichota bacterium]MCB9068909.1 aminoglycoside phosphotransferase family protein [Calditrichia bacterium]